MQNLEQLAETGIFSLDSNRNLHREFIPFNEELTAEEFNNEGISPMDFYDGERWNNVIIYYASMIEDGTELIAKLTKRETVALLRDCIYRIKTISEESISSTLKTLFSWLEERENLVATAVQACSKRTTKGIEEYANEIFENKVEAHYYLGLLYFTLDDLTNAKVEFDKGLKIAQKGTLIQGNLLYQLARICRSRSEMTKAEKLFDKAIKIYQNLPLDKAKEREANSLLEKGLILGDFGTFSEAIEIIKKSAAIFEQIGDELNYARSLVQIGNDFNFLDKFEQAQENYDKALPMLKKYNYIRGVAEIYLGIARIKEFHNDLDEAEHFGLLSLEINSKLGFRRRVGYCANRLSSIYDRKKDFEKAMNYVNEALDIWKSCGIIKGVSYALRVKAQVFEHIGDFKMAYYSYNGCVNIREKLGLAMQTTHGDYYERRDELKAKAGLTCNH